MRLGIIDVGTNSIHLLIGLLGLHGQFHVIVKERDLTRLGENGLATGRLTPTAMRRGLGVLQRYAETLRRCGVEQVEAVATSAVRGATNGRQFVRRVRQRVGVPLRVISGREEARLIYLGVLRAQRIRRPAMIVTIGGGSAQVIQGDGMRLRYATSVPLGGARLAQQFIRHDPPRPEEVEALQRAVRRAWAPIARAVRRHRWHHVLGCSATIEQLMMAAHLRRYRRPPHGPQRLSIDRGALRRLVGWLATSTAEARIQLPGLDPRREDLALTTAVTLLAWMELCGVSRLRYAPGSIREGLVIDYVIRHHQRVRRIEDPLAGLFGPNGMPDLPRSWRSRIVPRRPVRRHALGVQA
jgi:exopolyphosphatase/guanosine-5'-triphosphate,3'-diphosphate pyrophosphatase